jgi:hypothetical protein
MRLNMTSNLKVMLSALGVAALLASPAMAKSHARTHRAAPSIVNVPYDARASVQPYASAPVVTVYAPDLPTQPHRNGGLNPDFQLNHE